MTPTGNRRFDKTLQPVSGMAVPVYRGEVLRLTQVEGDQCVDFNCFNLHDYKDRMSVGHMRPQGFRVKQGHIVVSSALRPMLAITHMAETCMTDLLAARCDATSGEREYGIVRRTNCQDTFAESIREYGLTPDDVHDSFNLWMHTIWVDSFRSLRNFGPRGDYVDFLALMDVLAVPIICGSGDISQTSNFSFKPLKIEIFEASEQSNALTAQYLAGCAGSADQKPRQDQASGSIRAERELRPISGYRPRFQCCPVTYTDIDVEFAADELEALKDLRRQPGEDDASAARSAFMLWYLANRAKPHWIRPDGPDLSQARSV
jgi:uncharacterized protein YcgI (DUF1989 family)